MKENISLNILKEMNKLIIKVNLMVNKYFNLVENHKSYIMINYNQSMKNMYI